MNLLIIFTIILSIVCLLFGIYIYLIIDWDLNTFEIGLSVFMFFIVVVIFYIILIKKYPFIIDLLTPQPPSPPSSSSSSSSSSKCIKKNSIINKKNQTKLIPTIQKIKPELVPLIKNFGPIFDGYFIPGGPCSKEEENKTCFTIDQGMIDTLNQFKAMASSYNINIPDQINTPGKFKKRKCSDS